MAQNPVVTFEIERESAFGPETGIIKAELYPEVAPNSVNNFISLIQKGYYDGLIFHRVISGFMIQGGSDDSSLIAQSFDQSHGNAPFFGHFPGR